MSIMLILSGTVPFFLHFLNTLIVFLDFQKPLQAKRVFSVSLAICLYSGHYCSDIFSVKTGNMATGCDAFLAFDRRYGIHHCPKWKLLLYYYY